MKKSICALALSFFTQIENAEAFVSLPAPIKVMELYFDYQIKKGDTLYDITKSCKLIGNTRSSQDLLNIIIEDNNIKDSNKIKAGDYLTIPIDWCPGLYYSIDYCSVLVNSK